MPHLGAKVAESKVLPPPYGGKSELAIDQPAALVNVADL